jgi:hypothetical protein
VGGSGLRIVSIAEPTLVTYLDNKLGGVDWDGRIVLVIFSDFVAQAGIKLVPASTLRHVINDNESKFSVRHAMTVHTAERAVHISHGLEPLDDVHSRATAISGNIPFERCHPMRVAREIICAQGLPGLFRILEVPKIKLAVRNCADDLGEGELVAFHPGSRFLFFLLVFFLISRKDECLLGALPRPSRALRCLPKGWNSGRL